MEGMERTEIVMARGGGRAARGARAYLAVAVVISSVALVAAAPAGAVSLQHEYAVFSDCPVTVLQPESLCIVSTVTSGEFTLGSKTVPINRTVTLQGGVEGTTLVPAADGNTLSKTPLQLPGGLAGIELLPPLTEVTATAELAGTGSVSIANTLAGKGTAVSLPVVVKLDNPVLGANCYIGSGSQPLVLNLTTGTTSPPAPNHPITGSPGTLELGAGEGRIGKLAGVSLVDNAFAAPGVNGCGALPLLIDPLVDIDAGLPAAAGHNTAVMNGTVLNTEARLVVQEAALPELGRCVKARFEVIERERHYRGNWLDAACQNESRGFKSGAWEWFAGPGAANKFLLAGGATTFETTSGAKLVCAKATGSGEYTGSKTSSVTLKLHGCKYGATKLVCQSAGAATGEIVSSPIAGKLGFIQDDFREGTAFTKIGLLLTGAPSLLGAECGSQKTALTVAGSVIGELTPHSLMTGTFTLLFTQASGAQAPESFEEEAKQSLTLAFGGGAPEATGLSATPKLKNEEHLEVKAEV
jgi:hypothetical protein